jgi:biotin synthase-related radical SAM superfamily protein
MSVFCDGVSKLSKMGAIPILRLISHHPLRSGEALVGRPTAERLLKLGKATRRILDENGLRPDQAETMCLPCTGCDITPHRDI